MPFSGRWLSRQRTSQVVRALKALRNQNIMLCCLVLDTCGTGSTVWNRGSNNNRLLLQVVASTTDSPKPNCECPRKHQPQEFAGTHKGDSTTINLTLTRLLLRVIFSVVHKVHSGCYSLKNLSCEGRVIRLCWASCVGDPDKRIHNRQHLTGFERERPTETGSQERAIIDLLAKQA